MIAAKGGCARLVRELFQQLEMPLGHAESFGRERLGGGREPQRVDALLQVRHVLLQAIDGFLDEKIDLQIVRIGELDREIAVVRQAARFEDLLADALGQGILAGDDLARSSA